MKQTILLITILVFIFSLGLFGQQQTSDGGYIICGTTNSYTNGGYDYLVYRLDATGNKLWRKNYGGTKNELAAAIFQTGDGGFILCGWGSSYAVGQSDMLVYKLDAAGAKEWRKNYGGVGFERAFSIIQTSDGGYAVIGDSGSYTHGSYDFLVYKLSASGAKQWRRNYGGLNEDVGRAISQIPGGYIMAGYTYTYTNGSVDYLVYRVDAAGNQSWRKNFGGPSSDNGLDVCRTSGGSFLVSGYGANYTNGGCDLLVYKLDASGKKVWRKNYGGTKCEHQGYIGLTSDGGFALCGDTISYTTGSGAPDLVVYKLDAAGAKQWRKNFGGSDEEFGGRVGQTSDGGYFVFGHTRSYTHGSGDYDLLMYRLYPSGAKWWRKNFGGSNDDRHYF